MTRGRVYQGLRIRLYRGDGESWMQDIPRLALVGSRRTGKKYQTVVCVQLRSRHGSLDVDSEDLPLVESRLN
jgi:hypothetical protein